MYTLIGKGKANTTRKLMSTLYLLGVVTIEDYRAAISKLPVVARWTN